MNVFAAPIAGFLGAPMIAYWNYSQGDSPSAATLALMDLIYLLSLLAYSIGNLSLFWPYAVHNAPNRPVGVLSRRSIGA